MIFGFDSSPFCGPVPFCHSDEARDRGFSSATGTAMNEREWILRNGGCC